MVIRPMCKELEEKAESELGEVPSRVQKDVSYIQEWLSKQPHLNIRTEDQILVGFLRGCKYSLQRTKEKLDFFYTLKSLVPEYFTNRDPLLPEIQEVLKAGVFLPLPNTEGAEGPRIILFRWASCNPDKTPFMTLMQVYFMGIDILMHEDDNIMVSGMHLWSEFKDWNLNYMFQFTPSNLKKTLLCLQNAYPVRVKGIHCTHTSETFEKIFIVVRQFLSDKLKNRMDLYSAKNFESVHKHIPKRLMPKEYGGDAGSIQELTYIWKQKFESYREWFLEDSKYRSEEKLRPGTPKTSGDVFGVEGSFRELTVD